MYLRWLLTLPFAYLVTILCYFTNWFACLFPSRQPNGRDKLWGVFNLWSTYDAPVDEFYYGKYDTGLVSQERYNSSRVWRYWYRLRWLKRNTGYGWSYLLFSVPSGKGFHIKGVTTRTFFGKVNDYNIGWKSHPPFPKDDFAGRVVGLRSPQK